jgi:hypothetical protein
MNYAEKARKAIEFIGRQKSERGMRAAAEAFGIPEAAKMWYLTPEQRGRMGARMGMDERGTRASVQADFELAEAMTNLKDAFTSAMIPAIKELAGFAKMLTVVAIGFKVSPIGRMLDAMSGIGGGSGAGNAKDRHTEAIEENTRQLSENTKSRNAEGNARNGYLPGWQFDNMGSKPAVRQLRSGRI